MKEVKREGESERREERTLFLFGVWCREGMKHHTTCVHFLSEGISREPTHTHCPISPRAGSLATDVHTRWW